MSDPFGDRYSGRTRQLHQRIFLLLRVYFITVFNLFLLLRLIQFLMSENAQLVDNPRGFGRY